MQSMQSLASIFRHFTWDSWSFEAFSLRLLMDMISVSKAHKTVLQKFILLFWGLSLPTLATSQTSDWQIAGPYGGTATAVTIDPRNPKILLAGARQSLLYKSEDSGQSWRMLPFPKQSFAEVDAILVDPLDSQHYLVGLAASAQAGLFETIDGGVHWKPIAGLQGTGVRALAAAGSDPSRFVAGTTQGVHLSTDSGRTWSRISDPANLEMLGITAVAIDPKDPDMIYAGTTHLPWRTADGGKTWTSIHSGMIDDSDVFSIFVDPRSPNQVFASACSGIYQSANQGGMWRKMMGIPNSHRRTHVIRQDPEDPGIIYAGTTLGLFKSIDNGATWHQVNEQQVNSLIFDPAQPSDMYLALEEDGLWRSDDRGKTLSPLNNGFVSRRLTAVTMSGNRLVAIQTQDGSSTGIFVSADNGNNWEKLPHPAGLDGVHLTSITGVPGDDQLLFAANPRNAFKSTDGGLTWKLLAISAVSNEKSLFVKPRDAVCVIRRNQPRIVAQHR
jgi:photosystem II stability/assembly factor-like uncharacterized protein